MDDHTIASLDASLDTLVTTLRDAHPDSPDACVAQLRTVLLPAIAAAATVEGVTVAMLHGIARAALAPSTGWATSKSARNSLGAALTDDVARDGGDVATHVVLLALNSVDAATTDDDADGAVLLDRLNTAEITGRLVQMVWDEYGRPRYRSAVQLLCAVCLSCVLVKPALELLDHLFVSFVFDQIELTRDDTSLNYDLSKLLLAIHEQLTIAANRSGAGIGTNVVMDIVAERGTGLRTLSENVAEMFNRGGADDIRDGPDPAVQLLLLKFLYLVFSRRATADMFYPNDLKVLVEILLRGLTDLPREKHLVRQGHLRVLQGLLRMSPYRQQGRHKKAEVRQMLEGIWLDDQTDPATRAVAEQVLLTCADVLE